MKRFAVAVIALGCLPSCGKSAGGSTPRELFEISQAAAKAKNWAGYFDLVHPDDVDLALYHFTYSAALATKDDPAKAKDFVEFMKKHGAKETRPGENLDFSPDKIRATVRELFKDVKDKRGLFVDTMNLIDGISKPPAGAPPPVEPTLKEVKEEGDLARCTLDAGGHPVVMLARKREGRWFLGFER